MHLQQRGGAAASLSLQALQTASTAGTAGTADNTAAGNVSTIYCIVSAVSLPAAEVNCREDSNTATLNVNVIIVIELRHNYMIIYFVLYPILVRK